jgi:DNA mismatch repair protein MutS
MAMDFFSILFTKPKEDGEYETDQEPDFFRDLNLDQIIDEIIIGKKEYNLKPFFYLPLSNTENINYRQQIMKELEDEELSKKIKLFAEKMQKVRNLFSLLKQLDFKYNKEGWFLEAVEVYCQSVNTLAEDLQEYYLKSSGLIAFRNYISKYVKSDNFISLQTEQEQLKDDLSTVKYCVNINGDKVRVQEYQGESDYRPEVEQTFAKFKEKNAVSYLSKVAMGSGMNHIEAKILNLVAKLYPEIFSDLDDYYNRNKKFVDERIRDFDREIQFYISYIDYIKTFKKYGLKFCYPEVSTTDKEIYNKQGFDLALANSLNNKKSSIVCNDFYLQENERIIAVTGPNQGGKTTFARTFGQLHYLASLGCLIPGKEARLFLFDKLFTHFEREENIKDLRGKLEDDLVRIKNILDQATSSSLIIMNEIFASTTTRDAVFLGKKILKEIISQDTLAVFVTFLDELASLDNSSIVSMVVQVDSEDPTIRTYKILRKAADGVAYAVSIAKKYKLDYSCLKERIRK